MGSSTASTSAEPAKVWFGTTTRRAKGIHRHVGGDEAQVPYQFSSMEKLLNDFRVECEQLGWRWNE